MFKFYILSVFLSCTFFSFSQIPLDTISTDKGDVVLFNNNTWRYLVQDDFNGVLNDYLNSLLNSDSNVVFSRDWNNDVCFSTQQKQMLSNLKDTLWICVNDESNKEFCMPFNGEITSRYGYRKGRYHNGIDIDVEVGDTIRAVWSGRVRYAKFNNGGFGNLVIIRHHNGLETYYAHLDQLLCAPNQEVKAGDVIGLGGNTGRSYGAHLHFEMRFYDAPINPEEVIDFDNAYYKDENLLIHKHLFRPGAKPSDYEGVVEEEHHVVKPQVSKKYYKVKSGDTLSSIAKKNNTTIQNLCKLNGIRQTTVIQIGRSIRVR